MTYITSSYSDLLVVNQSINTVGIREAARLANLGTMNATERMLQDRRDAQSHRDARVAAYKTVLRTLRSMDKTNDMVLRAKVRAYYAAR